jgi:pimeloyl-ACP methyl ester carboxylesterase
MRHALNALHGLPAAIAAAIAAAFVSLLLNHAAAAAAAAASADAGPASGTFCTEPHTEAGASLPLRLPELHYACLSLRDGQAMWVGRARNPGQTTVLLVHGLGQNAHRDWADTVGSLVAAGMQVLTVDLPGFGASPPPAQAYAFDTLSDQLAELLVAVAPGQRVHVVGHSLGGAVSLHFAHRHAALVDRLVLVDAAGILLKPVYAHSVASVRRWQSGLAPVDGLISFLGDRVNSLSSLLMLGGDGRFDFGPWLQRNADVRRALLGGRVQVDAALSLVEHDFSAAIRETHAPTTVLWGRDDGIAPLRTGRLLAARLPQARLEVIDSAGHTPMLERPADFNRLLLQALAGPPPAQRTALPAPAALVSQGHVVCRQQDGAVYSGRFDSLTLDGCGDVRIEGAHIGWLVLERSVVQISDSVIASGHAEQPALSARGSEVQATNVQLQGRVAVRSENSYFDLAGVSLRASERAVELHGAPSRLFLSVSDWRGSDLQGDAHFIWPRPVR